MAERATVFERPQIGIESTAGTDVAATKKIQSFSISPAIQSESQVFRPMGSKFATSAIQNKEWTEASVEGYPDFNELAYLLSSLMSYAAPSGTAPAHTWTFGPSSSSADTVKSYTVETGSSVRAQQFTYGLVNELTFSYDRDELTISGSMLGQKSTDGITVTDLSAVATAATLTTALTGANNDLVFTAAVTGLAGREITITYTDPGAPGAAESVSVSGKRITFNLSTDGSSVITSTGDSIKATLLASVEASALVTAADAGANDGSGVVTALAETALTGGAGATWAIRPMSAAGVDVYIDTTSAGLGGTQLTRALSFEWTLGNRFSPHWVLNSSNGSWVAAVENAPDFTMKMMVQADAAGMGFLTQLRSGDTRFVRIQVTGPVLTGSTTYRLRFDAAVKFTGIGEYSDEDGVYAIEYEMTGVHDDGWGKALSVALVNNVSAL
jgi:hypothetical protein